MDDEESAPRAERQLTAPHALDVGGEDWASGNIAAPAWRAWREELAGIGGRSPLIHFLDAPSTRIELSTTHPGGLARFITGATTLLSNLIRDDMALRTARRAADQIAEKGLELATTRGIDAVELGIGIATWRHDAVDYCGPILLRPLAIRRAGRDFEVKLRGGPRLNPAFAHALETQFGISLDAEAFVALTDADGTFKPNAVIDQLRALTGHLQDFAVQPRLVVSTFAEVATAMTADAATLEHPVLDALGGNKTAKWTLEQAVNPVESGDPDRREPSTDTLLLDADAEQEHVVAQIAAGNSLVVKTMPGTGGTQTIVNAIGALVQQNKRVLVTSPRRASLRAIAERFSEIGLPGVAVSPRSLRRDLVRGIGRNEKAQSPQVGDIDEALVRLRSVLLDYRGALTRPDGALGISVFDCVTELSRLALLPDPPSTGARLSRRTVEALAEDRTLAATTIVDAARLGEFRYGPGDSPWYGAQFASGEEAGRAHALAKRLQAEGLPRLLVRATELIGSTRMRPFETVAELGVYLRLLTELRDTLDRFVPAVFDRPLTELIAATASRRDSPAMTAPNRRRLRKLAREYVRPGMHVGDLHEALTRIQQQRLLWQRYVAAGVAPEVPVGIADVQVAWQQVAQDLAVIDGPLGLTGEQRLEALPLTELGSRLQLLAADSEVLDNLQERSALMATLKHLELDPLMTDLSARHVPEHQVAAELELAWWRSALDSLLESDRALLGANTGVLERLEADFRLVDEAHASGSAQLLAWQLAESWKIGLVDWPEEATALKRALTRPGATSQALARTAPHLARPIAPVWLASPYEMAEVSTELGFDAVLLVDAGAMTIAEAVGGIRRAAQVVAFGDPVTQTPAPFLTAIGDPDAADELPAIDLDELHARSALAQLSGLLPVLSLTRSYRAGGEDLAELVNRRFYAGRIDSLPWAGSFLGHGSLVLDYVDDGTGLPDPVTGSVESVDAEVDRVVQLVRQHATTRPRESLMVVTASEKHAVRVLEAVLRATVDDTALSDFVAADRPEPFAVTTIERAAAQSRDRVVFSLGYGRTPHGRVLSDFGALGKPGGERLLAVAMTRARRSLHIVTCFRPADVEDGRMRHGAIALAEILDEVAARHAEPALPDDGDPMLVDLARRLEARGLRVALGHRGKLGLVVANGGTCIVVDTDAVLMGRSLRESLRLRPEVLRRLGWHYARVHAFELFGDPEAVADRVARLAGLAAGPRTQEIPIQGA
ncbi:AAA family ATPase [Homoserinibacter sp. YIM 151385]|uniref:AAA family ATPase n=1 Tax=Homoserinibacter sp. YIM 151385 TaxID=2985506 RepID=UPI0022F10CBD|nr:AAA family ATPase [Homoserinibacter sp. YIM 151385]WBU37905.1 AAA family ATPase [Homoserinibacter sp. YIM 151385]